MNKEKLISIEMNSGYHAKKPLTDIFKEGGIFYYNGYYYMVEKTDTLKIKLIMMDNDDIINLINKYYPNQYNFYLYNRFLFVEKLYNVTNRNDEYLKHNTVIDDIDNIIKIIR